jgi:hypothetical protein
MSIRVRTHKICKQNGSVLGAHKFIVTMLNKRSRDSSVGIATSYGIDGWISIPGSGKNLLFSTASRLALEPTQVRGNISEGIKRPGREADHSSPSSVEVKNGGAIPPFPNMYCWQST